MQTYYNGEQFLFENVKVIHNDNTIIFNPREENFNECGYKKVEEIDTPYCDYSTHIIDVCYLETDTSWQKIYTVRPLTPEELEFNEVLQCVED